MAWPAGPVADHALDHQAGPGLDARDLAPALEHQQDLAGAVGQDALEVRRAGPGLDPHRLDPAGHPDPLAPLDLADRAWSPRPGSPNAARSKDATAACRSAARRAARLVRATGPAAGVEPARRRPSHVVRVAVENQPPVSW